MKMVIHNGNPTSRQIRSMELATKEENKQARINAPKSLNSSMISRIHNIKAGCGCGK